jgi:predicted 2-oxoglutarate/Fe(II)-dependent dioxygenase YbiX
MTPQSLLDYVKVYKNHLSSSLCEAAVESLSKSNWTEHSFYDVRKNKSISFEKELSVSHDSIPEKDEINKQIWFAIEKYILKDFSSFDKWFNGWNGYSDVRFNRYDPSTQMKLHCDHIQSMFDGERKGIPTLTVLGALNDDYEGGEFLMFGDRQIHLPAGAVVVFPSNFMFPHEVKPVKSGIRYSYVSWTW